MFVILFVPAPGSSGDVPLGKLTEAQIGKGQDVLQDLEGAIEKGSTIKINQLSSKYYSLIPTVVGRQAPPPINTEELLREKEELLKFYLRMGFEDMAEDDGLAPIAGVMDLPLPKTLSAAASGVCTAYDIKKCVDQGTKLAKNQAGKPRKKMSKELYASIMLYTSNAIYSQLNKVLRNEDRRGVKKYFSYLRMFLEAFATLPPHNATLWRGISCDLFDQYKPGETITWWGVSSCTSDKSVAEGFMRGCGGKCKRKTWPKHFAEFARLCGCGCGCGCGRGCGRGCLCPCARLSKRSTSDAFTSRQSTFTFSASVALLCLHTSAPFTTPFT